MTRGRIIKVALLAVAVLLVVGVARSCTDDDHTISVVAQFDNASGLYEGNAVSVLGMPVGKVTKITPHAGFVDVAMDISTDTPVPADASAVTVSTSVLTDRHVELTPAYQGGPQLQDNAHLGLNQTRTPVEVDRMLAMADKLSVQLQGDNRGGGPVADLLNVSAAMTSGNGPDIRSALGSLSRALAMGSDHGEQTRNAITDIVDDMSSLSATAARNDATIREFGSSVQQMSDLFADQNIGWGTTGAKINAVLGEATDLMQQRRKDVADTVSGATTVTRALADYRRSLSEFLDVAPLVMDNAYNTIDKKAGVARVHAQLEKVFFDGRLVKEVCNVLGMRELGCATGTLRDFGPDFGMDGMLEAMAGKPQ
ncbi:MCE family protein [Gordonia sp. DT218]|uniref:MCE family protein n=1 Tax=Gordonia sp. DT218 TaxID=3416659 RepID=UPI003CE9F338